MEARSKRSSGGSSCFVPYHSSHSIPAGRGKRDSSCRRTSDAGKLRACIADFKSSLARLGDCSALPEEVRSDVRELVAAAELVVPRSAVAAASADVASPSSAASDPADADDSSDPKRDGSYIAGVSIVQQAWDYPLSREEKMMRLNKLLCLEIIAQEHVKRKLPTKGELVDHFGSFLRRLDSCAGVEPLKPRASCGADVDTDSSQAQAAVLPKRVGAVATPTPTQQKKRTDWGGARGATQIPPPRQRGAWSAAHPALRGRLRELAETPVPKWMTHLSTEQMQMFDVMQAQEEIQRLRARNERSIKQMRASKSAAAVGTSSLDEVSLLSLASSVASTKTNNGGQKATTAEAPTLLRPPPTSGKTLRAVSPQKGMLLRPPTPLRTTPSLRACSPPKGMIPRCPSPLSGTMSRPAMNAKVGGPPSPGTPLQHLQTTPPNHGMTPRLQQLTQTPQRTARSTEELQALEIERARQKVRALRAKNERTMSSVRAGTIA